MTCILQTALQSREFLTWIHRTPWYIMERPQVHYGEATGTARSFEILSKIKYLYLFAFVVDLKVYSFCQILKGRRVFQEVLICVSKSYQVVCAECFPSLAPIPKHPIYLPSFDLHGLLQFTTLCPLASKADGRH